MRFSVFAPANCLTDLVERYWYVTSPAQQGATDQTWLPSVTHSLVLNLNNNLQSIITRQGQKKPPPCFVIGNLTSPGHITANGPFDVFAVQFKPTGIYQLFNIPLSRLLDTPVDFEEIEKRSVARDLLEELQTATAPFGYIALLEKYFKRKLGEAVPDRKLKMFEPVVQCVLSQKGCIQIKELTQLAYYTKKTLERHCTELIGPTPKQFISITRFSAAIDYLRKNDCHSIKDFIFDLGYFDHSHFLHDFKKLSGQTPREVCARLTDPDHFFYGL